MSITQSDSSRRLYLRAATKLLLLFAFGAVAVLALGYLLPPGGEDPRQDAWARQIDLSGLGIGEIRRVEWPGGTVGVYRRSAVQVAALSSPASGSPESALGDPHSRRSRQPEAARNPGRSLRAEYFVFLLQAPGRGCRVRLADSAPAGGVPWQGGFFDPCGGTWFDPAGRAYRPSASGAPQENLTVPPHRYVGEKQIRLEPPG